MYILSNRGHKVTFSKQFQGSMKGRTICWVLVEHKNIISSGKLLPWVTLYISIFTSTLCAPKYLVSFFEKVNTHTHKHRQLLNSLLFLDYIYSSFIFVLTMTTCRYPYCHPHPSLDLSPVPKDVIFCERQYQQHYHPNY